MTPLRRGARRSAAYDPDCTRCPRLARYLEATRASHAGYWARPVPSFGDGQPKLLIVGLAPGMHGANRTGRPFTGDFAGILLYRTLHELGLASAAVSTAADDGLELREARIANAVKCVPPGNKPLPEEIGRCNAFLKEELAALPTVRAYLALGRIAHDAVLLAQGLKRARYPFAHAREHGLDGARWLVDSYHCSRYNTQTRRLSAAMFREVVERACELAGMR